VLGGISVVVVGGGVVDFVVVVGGAGVGGHFSLIAPLANTFLFLLYNLVEISHLVLTSLSVIGQLLKFFL